MIVNNTIYQFIVLLINFISVGWFGVSLVEDAIINNADTQYRVELSKNILVFFAILFLVNILISFRNYYTQWQRKRIPIEEATKLVKKYLTVDLRDQSQFYPSEVAIALDLPYLTTVEAIKSLGIEVSTIPIEEVNEFLEETP